MINTMLSAIPTYFLSFFLIPKWVGKGDRFIKKKIPMERC